MFKKERLQDAQYQLKELCSLLKSLHPVETLKRAYWEFIFQHLGKETESTIGTEEVHSRFLVEYLQSLFISIENADL